MSDEGCTPNMPLLGDRFPEMTVKTTHGMKDLPGDRVIIPPAQTVADAAERPTQYDCYDCYDWWFCHTALEDEQQGS